MTKVSMRHLNEIVRERNQYSRDALEAWQDFINLKGRMDTELGKVTKRNNYLVEELESWKQQVCSYIRSKQWHGRTNANVTVPQVPGLRRATYQGDPGPQGQDREPQA